MLPAKRRLQAWLLPLMQPLPAGLDLRTSAKMLQKNGGFPTTLSDGTVTELTHITSAHSFSTSSSRSPTQPQGPGGCAFHEPERLKNKRVWCTALMAAGDKTGGPRVHLGKGAQARGRTDARWACGEVSSVVIEFPKTDPDVCSSSALGCSRDQSPRGAREAAPEKRVLQSCPRGRGRSWGDLS